MSDLLSKLFSLARRDAPLMDYREAKRLAAHPDHGVRRKLARRGDVQPEILYYLAGDPAAGVRHEIAANEATPVQADLLLARDGDDDVRCSVARKVCRLAPQLSPDQRARVGDIVAEVLQTLADDQLPRVRRILAEALKDVATVPAGVIERLARDESVAVSGPVLEHSPLLSDKVLLEIVESRPVQDALCAISRRSDLRPTVADAIVEADNEEAITALLANTSAQIREETLDRLVDRAENVPAWHAPLVARPKLSQRAIRGLAEIVAESLVVKLRKRHDIDEETASLLTRTVRRRLDAEGPPDGGVARSEAPSDGDGASAEERARRLNASGALDEEAFVAALGRGDRTFVIAALAERSGVPAPVVEKIVAMASTKGMIAVVWKAGLGMKLAEQLQLRLSRINPSSVMKARKGGRFPLTADEMVWQLEFFGA